MASALLCGSGVNDSVTEDDEREFRRDEEILGRIVEWEIRDSVYAERCPVHEAEYILILSGDQLYQMDFQKMLDNHVAQGADISIATIPVAEREAPEFGILKSDENGWITSFIEKPSVDILHEWVSDTGAEMHHKGRLYLASMGIYIFNRKLLSDLLLEDYRTATDFGKEIIPSSISNHKVASYQYEGYWTDIGNIYSFFEAFLALTQEQRILTKLYSFTKSLKRPSRK
jgi:ADP-glucose pyrophosphorylase